MTERSLYTALMEMRRLDVTRDSVLRPGLIDEVIRSHSLPLGPCLPHLHTRFRDSRFRRSTNYERLMTYLEVISSSASLYHHDYQERMSERQRLGPEEVRDWSEWAWNKRMPFRFHNSSSSSSENVKKPRLNFSFYLRSYVSISEGSWPCL